MRTGYVWHPWYGWHDTGTSAGVHHASPVDGIQPYQHFEHPATKKRMHELVESTGLLAKLDRIHPEPATRADLERVHDRAYLDRLERDSRASGGDAGNGSPFGHGGFDVARLSAGGTIAALDAVVSGRVRNAYALTRPPGHHARPSTGMGFCLLNNIGIAIRRAIGDGDVRRVAVVDWDVHHGNGTQEIFHADSNVMTISLHQDRNFPPDSGNLDECGEGSGRGANINIPLPPGTGHAGYLTAMDQVVIPALIRFRPELIVVACGFDAGNADPLGRQMLTSSTFREMTRRIMAAADELCHGRLLVNHEGGYSPVCVPFYGLNVLENLAGVDTGITDPFEANHAAAGQQELQPHQRAVINHATGLVARVPA